MSVDGIALEADGAVNSEDLSKPKNADVTAAHSISASRRAYARWRYAYDVEVCKRDGRTRCA